MNITEITSWLATVSTVGLFLSSMPTCVQIIRKASSSDVNFFPFLAMLCNAALWTKYGTIKGDRTLVLVNGTGFGLNVLYIGIYYTYTVYKTAIFRQLMVGALVVFPTLIYVQFYILERHLAIARLGFMCCVLGVVAYGAPLSAMTTVVRTKSTEMMPFPLSLANFVVSTEWTTYGYLVSDWNIITPNGLGMILGGVQLLLFCKYPSRLGRSHENLGRRGVVQAT